MSAALAYDAPRRPGAPPSSFVAAPKPAPTSYLPTDGAAVRATLVASGVLVPADVVATRPEEPHWHDAPATLRLTGAENWRSNVLPWREARPSLASDGRSRAWRP